MAAALLGGAMVVVVVSGKLLVELKYTGLIIESRKSLPVASTEIELTLGVPAEHSTAASFLSSPLFLWNTLHTAHSSWHIQSKEKIPSRYQNLDEDGAGNFQQKKSRNAKLKNCPYLGTTVQQVCVVPGLALEAELVHDPVGLGPPRRSAHVEHQRLLHPHQLTATSIIGRSWLEDLPVLAGCLPVALLGGTVCAHPGWVFHALVAEEVPLLPHLRLA
jgi:hypothetical protein